MTNLPFFHRVESCQRSDVTPGGVFQIALLFERQRRLLKAKGNMWTPRCFTAQTVLSLGSGCSLSFSLLSSPSSSFFCDKAVISESANLA
ncbi:hypothetical protein LWI28_017879 [Acer negundo]|uniref:Uncharacterized protein n=1 Tax=Acer negundo TaxID=4023 RepID=A0AAD5NFZ4_ACENE|nr:hypothetical protein LWI28_017879 [Acer negundo]